MKPIVANTKLIYRLVQNNLNYFLLNQGKNCNSSSSYKQIFLTKSKQKRNELLDLFVYHFGIKYYLKKRQSN